VCRLLLLLLPVALRAAPASSCAPCHREIYDAWRRTPMAQTSGAAAAADLTHAAFAAAGYRYRVFRDGEALSFDFSGAGVHATRTLSWFIGSGATARSFLLSGDGYLFEAPVAWYRAGDKWDLAPSYDRYTYPFLTRPALPACLNCHATGIQVVSGTHNRYADPPFAEPGITCERCHGAGERHIASATAATIVNPASLAPDRRDSVCAQCHLSGEVRVMRPGTTWSTYRPGDRLADSVAVFVRAGGTPGMTVTSHVEKLAQSRCKRVSGDALWCGSCHDPHGLSAPSRQKCLFCHESHPCTETLAARNRKQDECAACHMPKSSVTDAQHVVYTDHSIPRRPRPAVAAAPTSTDLVPFGGGRSTARDLALAWGIVAARGDRVADRPRAEALLATALQESPGDVELLLYLGEIYRNTDRGDFAIPLFQRAIRLDPAQLTASVGLGGIYLERGRPADAIPLWEDALKKDAGLVLVRTNLALAYWQTGDLRAAEQHLAKAVAMAPGLAAPAELLEKLRRARQ